MKLKHKISLLVIGILLVVSLLISSSYALWVFNVSQESTNVLVSDCFEITLQDNNPIGLSASFPLRDSDGVKTTPYTFTIKNICNHPADFQINLETLNTSTIDEDFIKVDLNGHITEYNAAESVEPTISGARSAAMLYEDTLAVNGEKTYNLRIWVNENATQEDVENKSYASKVSVKATVRRQYAEGTLVNGCSFNIALKTLSGDSEATCSLENTSITSIRRSTVSPTAEDNTVIISDDKSGIPVYAWFDNGTIYIYSDSDKIYLNPDSSYLFNELQKVESIDLSMFDTSKVTTMRSMFRYNQSLKSIDVSNFDTSNVSNMYSMFSVTNNLEKLDLRSFNTSNVTNFSYMFYSCYASELIIDNFNTSKGTDMSFMFYDTKNLETINLNSFDTSNTTSMQNMFSYSGLKEINLNNFDTPSVKNMSSMFLEMKNLNSLDVSSFDTSKVTFMANTFRGLSNLTYLNLGDNFDTSNVVSMPCMFYGLEKITELNLGNRFDTSKVVEMNQMFYGTSSIDFLNLGDKFDTSSVTDMKGMFMRYGGKKINFGSKFNVNSATNIRRMFYDAQNLEELDLSFIGANNFEEITGMFYNAKNLKTIYVSDKIDFSNTALNSDVFKGCKSIIGGAGTTYDSNHVDAEYARIDDPENGKPGYFTLKTN